MRWTEHERLDVSAARATSADSEVAAADANVTAQPVFCFETALKALYFSFLVRHVHYCGQLLLQCGLLEVRHLCVGGLS